MEKKFYCQIKIDGVRYWGYREALTGDLALACFIQDKGFTEDEVDGRSFYETVDFILVSRLLEFIPEDLDPWGCDTPFTIENVSEVDEGDIERFGTSEYNDFATGYIADRFWHASRVLWFVKNPEMLEDPISIDNHCHYGHVYPVPEIMDGWHRLFAHRFLGLERIPALYSGRVDLLKYLTGKTDKLPE